MENATQHKAEMKHLQMLGGKKTEKGENGKNDEMKNVQILGNHIVKISGEKRHKYDPQKVKQRQMLW